MPSVSRAAVAGMRCSVCRYPVVGRRARCPVCKGPLDETEFSANGTVWSATVVHIAVPGHSPPYGLVYVDVDDGPRVLAHARAERLPSIGGRVQLTERDGGILVAEDLS